LSVPRHPTTQGLLAGVLDLLEPKPIRVAIEGAVPDLVRATSRWPALVAG